MSDAQDAILQMLAQQGIAGSVDPEFLSSIQQRVFNEVRNFTALITSIDPIVVSSDNTAPSLLTGLEYATTGETYMPISVDAITGDIENITTDRFVLAVGNLAVQPDRTGGGGSSILRVGSETAFDGVNYGNTDFSLRNQEIVNDSENFWTTPAALLLPPGAKTRFMAWNDGGSTITLVGPEATVRGAPIFGPSVSITLQGYSFLTTP